VCLRGAALRQPAVVHLVRPCDDGALVTALRLLETVHGHLGVLAAVALLHPAILLRKGAALTPRTRLAVILTGSLVASVFATGLFVYTPYRTHVRAGLFHASPTAGLLFETKEHLAYAVLSCTLGALVATLLAPRDGRALRRAASTVFAVAAALCILVVGLGSYVTAVHGFGAR
jgi:hypothetical protein